MTRTRFLLPFLLLVLLALSGCCSCAERYDPTLEQWQSNLERLRPTVEAGAATLPEDLRASKVGLLDDTVNGIKRVRGEGPEVWQGGAQ